MYLPPRPSDFGCLCFTQLPEFFFLWDQRPFWLVSLKLRDTEPGHAPEIWLLQLVVLTPGSSRVHVPS